MLSLNRPGIPVLIVQTISLMIRFQYYLHDLNTPVYQVFYQV